MLLSLTPKSANYVTLCPETGEPVVQLCGRVPGHCADGVDHRSRVDAAGGGALWLRRPCHQPVEARPGLAQVLPQGQPAVREVTAGAPDPAAALCPRATLLQGHGLLHAGPAEAGQFSYIFSGRQVGSEGNYYCNESWR